jgi:hypothetical protein
MAASHKRDTSVESTLQYNADVYRNHYANPLQELRYDCLYRAKRVARLLRQARLVLASARASTASTPATTCDLWTRPTPSSASNRLRQR